LNKSHECDGDDNGTKGEDDGQPELVWSRDGEVSQEVKWENHGYDVDKSLLVKLRTMDDLARHILNTSAAMSALVANLIDASARRRSSGKLQPAISASVGGSWSLVEQCKDNCVCDLPGLQYRYNGEHVKKFESMQAK
jgi:hypothetical protein